MTEAEKIIQRLELEPHPEGDAAVGRNRDGVRPESLGRGQVYTVELDHIGVIDVNVKGVGKTVHAGDSPFLYIFEGDGLRKSSAG